MRWCCQPAWMFQAIVPSHIHSVTWMRSAGSPTSLEYAASTTTYVTIAMIRARRVVTTGCATRSSTVGSSAASPICPPRRRSYIGDVGRARGCHRRATEAVSADELGEQLAQIGVVRRRRGSLRSPAAPGRRSAAPWPSTLLPSAVSRDLVHATVGRTAGPGDQAARLELLDEAEHGRRRHAHAAAMWFCEHGSSRADDREQPEVARMHADVARAPPRRACAADGGRG